MKKHKQHRCNRYGLRGTISHSLLLYINNKLKHELPVIRPFDVTKKNDLNELFKSIYQDKISDCVIGGFDTFIKAFNK